MSEQKDKPMSSLHFKFMAFGFRWRDKFHDPGKVLQRVGIREGQTILDFGCGLGGYTIPAAEMVGERGKVYALDIHPLAIEAVEKNARKKRMTNITTILSDRDTGLPDESVDVILLYDTIHGIGDKQALLKELHRVLKSDGFLSVSDHHLKEDGTLKVVEENGLFSLMEQDKEILNFRKAISDGGQSARQP